jgi:hypothetical protein
MTKEDKRRDKYYRRKYGITLNDYKAMMHKQRGCCGVCNKSHLEFKRRLAVDHDHETGKVRGLLCFYCNRHRVGKLNFLWASRVYDYLLRVI